MPHNDVKLKISSWQSKPFSINTIILLRGGKEKKCDSKYIQGRQQEMQRCARLHVDTINIHLSAR